ncbi:MAG: HAMP domain-containing protein [Actinomycetota bacterium]
MYAPPAQGGVMSLRARLVLLLLVLVGAGLLVADAVTFTSLRVFLIRRVDQQLLDARALVGRGLFDEDRGPEPHGPRFPRRSGGTTSLPPGTYAQLRDSDGKVVEDVSFDFNQEGGLAPDFPATTPSDGTGGPQLSTISARGDESVRYRVLSQPVADGGSFLLAVPLGEATQTLNRLLLIEGLVTLGILLGLAVLARRAVRTGLRPLEEIEATAGAIAAGDLSRRVDHTDGRTEVGRLGTALNAMLSQIEQAFEARTASEARLRRFLTDASHELRTPLTSIRGYASRVASLPGTAGKARGGLWPGSSRSARLALLGEPSLRPGSSMSARLASLGEPCLRRRRSMPAGPRLARCLPGPA